MKYITKKYNTTSNIKSCKKCTYLKSKRTSLVLLTTMEGATTLRWMPSRKRMTITTVLVENMGCNHIDSRKDTLKKYFRYIKKDSL